MTRNWLLLLPVAAVLILGQLGLSRAEAPGDALTHLYLLLQLFALEGDWTRDFATLPWELELARFLAPITTVGSLVYVFASDIRIALDNALARFRRDHVIVAGLSEMGLHFLQTCRQAGRRVTVLQERAGEPGAAQRDGALAAQARRLGHRVLTVDAIDDAALLAAGIARAAYLVAFTPDDGDNVEIALRAKRLLRDRTRDDASPLQIRLHLEDTHLATRLEDYPKFFEDYAAAEVSFFNVHERSARRLFSEHAMDLYADALGAERFHLVIIGTGALQEQVLLQTLRQAHFTDGAPPRVTLIGPDVEPAFASFLANHPGAADVGEVSCIELESTDGELERVLPRERLADVTAWAICLPTDLGALRCALALRKAILSGCGGNGPIFVAMRHGHGLARLLESESGEPEVPDGIVPFGLLDDALSEEQILDERQDRLARALHADYLAAADNVSGSTFHDNPAHRSWNLLPEIYRRENRTQADHLDVTLRASDRRLSDAGRSRRYDEAELDALAELEHRRWCAARRTNGWRYGEKRSDLDKVHDALVPWAALPEPRRQQNRDGVNALLSITESRLGLHCRPCVFVGVTGHRPNRLGTDLAALERAIEATLAAIMADYPDHQLVLLSPLAEGADRIAARVALDRFSAKLHVPLPLPYELHIGSFGVSPEFDQHASNMEFRGLVGLAERYYEMPLRFGSFAELADPEAEALRARQFALCGAYVVQRCHELIGIWDGEPATGEGGTPQILEWRRNGVPEEYRFGCRFFPERGSAAPWIIPATPHGVFRPERT